MKIELNVVMPGGLSYVWNYQGVALSMGRDPACDMTVDNSLPRNVSRRHARVERGENGTLVVRDFQSRNGTYLNGARVSGVSGPLKLGDEIRLGRKGPRLIILKCVPDGKAKHAACPPPLPLKRSTFQKAIRAAARHRVRPDIAQWTLAVAGTVAIAVVTMLVSMLWLSAPPPAPSPPAVASHLQTEQPTHLDVVVTYRRSNPGGHDRASQ
jgi:hypothetical protein